MNGTHSCSPRRIPLMLAVAWSAATLAATDAAPVGDALAATVVISNPAVTVAVAPGCGRIISVARPGSANLLWVAPHLSTGWANPGGDRVWPWPMGDALAEWKAVMGRGWPPPDACDQPHALTAIGDGCRLVSASLAGFQVHIEREIQPTPDGFAVTSRLRRDAGAGIGRPVGPWEVAQVRVPQAIYVHLAPSGGPGATVASPPDAAWSRWRWLGDDVVEAVIDPTATAKAFFDADRVAALWSDGTLAVLTSCAAPGEVWNRGERIQVYSAHGTGYVELELTGPLRALAPGEDAGMRVSWCLTHIEPGNEAAIRGRMHGP